MQVIRVNKKIVLQTGIILLIFQIMQGQEKIVATIRPYAMILEEITGTQVTCLLKAGDSPHTHTLLPSGIKEVERADLFFYGHENLDRWALDIPNNHLISMNALLPDTSREMIKSTFGKSRGDLLGEDPHFWLDPLAVDGLVPNLVDTLCVYIQLQCPDLRENSHVFSKKIHRLMIDLSLQLSTVKDKTVLLAHPFFQYYLDRFQIHSIGIIEPIPGKEPTPKEIEEIIKAVLKNNVSAILVNEQLSDRAAHLIAESTGVPIIALDPIGGLPGRMTYFELLRYNTGKLLQGIK